MEKEGKQTFYTGGCETNEACKQNISYFASVQDGSSTSCFLSQGQIQINEKELKSVVNNANQS